MSPENYARTRWAGDLCLFAGIVASPERLDRNLTGQANDVFAQLRRRLDEQGLTLRDVISVTCYLADPDDFDAYERVWLDAFPDDPPVRTTLSARLLVPGALLEVRVAAARKPKGRWA